MGKPDFDAVVDWIYEAASAEDMLPSALRRLTEHLGAFDTHLQILPKRPNARPACFRAGRFNPEAFDVYERHYRSCDDTLRLMVPPGEAVSSERQLGEGVVRRSEYHNDFLIPQGGRHVLDVHVLETDASDVRMAVHRSVRQGGFDRDEMARIRPVIPHLQRAVRLYRRFLQVAQARRQGEPALDRLAFGLVACEGDRRILAMNVTAERIVAARDGLEAHRGILLAESSDDDAQLHRRLVDAAKLGRGGAMRVRRPSGRESWRVLVGTQRPESQPILTDREIPAAIVMVAEHEELPEAAGPAR